MIGPILLSEEDFHHHKMPTNIHQRQNIKLSFAAVAMVTVAAHADKQLITLPQDSELGNISNMQDRVLPISVPSQKRENLISQQISPMHPDYLAETPAVSLTDVDCYQRHSTNPFNPSVSTVKIESSV